MSSIIIQVAGKEVPFVDADLRFRESNNSFTDSIELPHAKFPIRIPENTQTVEALGAPSLTAARKQRNYDCIIIIGQNRYRGTLEIIKYFNTYRKADLSYNSPVKDLLSSKIYDFLPAINLKGDDPDSVPFSPRSDQEFNAQVELNNYATSNLLKTFPEIQWQLPSFIHPDRIEEGKKEIDEDFSFYKEAINGRDSNGDLFINDATVTPTEFEVRNRNIICPKVFVMSPLLNALESIGYTLKGAGAFHPLIKSLLYYSEEDQMTEIQYRTPGQFFDPSLTPTWSFSFASPIGVSWQRRSELTMNIQGNITVNIKLEWAPTTITNRDTYVSVVWQNNIVFSEVFFDPVDYQAQTNITVDSNNVGDTLTFFLHQRQQFPEPIVFEVETVKDQKENLFYDVHPTIDFKRYVPDWTISNLLSNLKLFNLKPVIDDVSKEFSLVFNEQDYLFKRDAVVIKGNRNLREFDNIENDNFVLRYDNDTDEYISINQDQSIINGIVNDRTAVFNSEFNIVPHNGNTSIINETYLDKKGVGLMIYNPLNAPFVSTEVNGASLSITGNNGIYNSFHKAWISFLLDGSIVPINLQVSSTLLQEILKKQDIFVNGKRFLLVESDYKPKGQNVYDLNLKLMSVNI
ncbi:hypothetical protein JCM19294_1114 [Nonlabens tegetincola]|uniref:Uncharacterized protein n=1 Tax=Nonlabens tegetincola TaxID=323273 RepID=A0A090Q195_9FLAO|nr:hypothetical protein [Nonlabens tegetincola]GAK96805.1 hypothetical protein JCM19294_1114 [Nonlabens tegetincola]